MTHRSPGRALLRTSRVSLFRAASLPGQLLETPLSEQRPPRDSYQVETPLSLFK